MQNKTVFPNVPKEIAKRIKSGESPVNISGNILTRAEAHDWLMNFPNHTPLSYLIEKLVSNLSEGQKLWFIKNNCNFHDTIKSIKVVRWIEYLYKSEREYILFCHHNVQHVGTKNYLENFSLTKYLHYLNDNDITTVRTSLKKILSSLEKKLYLEFIEDIKDIPKIRNPPYWVKLITSSYKKYIQYINSSNQLISLAEEFENCLLDFYYHIRRNETNILYIKTNIGQSLAELSNSCYVIQHLSKKNSGPPEENSNLLEKFIKEARSLHRTEQ